MPRIGQIGRSAYFLAACCLIFGVDAQVAGDGGGLGP